MMEEIGLRSYVAGALALGGIIFIAVALHALWKHRKDYH